MIGHGWKKEGGFSTAPLVVGAGLVVAYQMLVRLVPALWANILPGGFEQGAWFVGPPCIVWRLAWFCHLQFGSVLTLACVATLTAHALARRRTTSPIAWAMGVLTILLDASILLVAIRAGMAANGLDRIIA